MEEAEVENAGDREREGERDEGKESFSIFYERRRRKRYQLSESDKK